MLVTAAVGMLLDDLSTCWDDSPSVNTTHTANNTHQETSTSTLTAFISRWMERMDGCLGCRQRHNGRLQYSLWPNVVRPAVNQLSQHHYQWVIHSQPWWLPQKCNTERQHVTTSNCIQHEIPQHPNGPSQTSCGDKVSEKNHQCSFSCLRPWETSLHPLP